ncbi:MAG: hypothetical protein ABIK79_05775 [Chloroflexota bacterium]|nr:hypothetical protein [Anaerolineae bacterium]
MKRRDAFRKLRTICQRIDEAGEFPVIPLRLYLFGSLLTEKPNPSDMDLLFEYRERSDLDPDDILHRLSYGKPLPHDQAVKHLRRGMKMIRIELLVGNVEDWLEEHGFPPDTPMRLVWEPGLKWQHEVDEIESCPAPWDSDQEKHHKYLQGNFTQLVEEQGLEAARGWFGRQINPRLR